jgi:hypothetical protein
VKGLKGQWLLQDQNDPDAGYAVSQWESEEDMQDVWDSKKRGEAMAVLREPVHDHQLRGSDSIVILIGGAIRFGALLYQPERDTGVWRPILQGGRNGSSKRVKDHRGFTDQLRCRYPGRPHTSKQDIARNHWSARDRGEGEREKRQD